MKKIVFRKALGIIVVLIALPALVWAGGQGEADGQEEITTLRIITNYGLEHASSAPLEAFYAEFEAANPGIKLEIEIATVENIPLKVETGFLAGEEAEIVFQNYLANVMNWVEDGIVIPIDDLLTDWDLDDQFLDSALTTFKTPKGDKISGFPLEGFSWPIWYNTAIFEEAGAAIPTTTDELIAAAQKIRAAGYQPITTQGGGGGFMLFGMVVHSYLEQADAKRLFTEGGFGDDPNARKGIEHFVKLRNAGVFSDDSYALDGPGSKLEFDSGVAAMAHMGSWSYAGAPTELLESITLQGFPLPSDSVPDKPLVFGSFLAKGVYITRNGTKKLDAVEKFIKSFYEPENIARIVEAAGITSPLKNTPVDPEKVPVLNQKAALMMPDSTVVPPVGSYLPGTIRSAALALATTFYTEGVSADEIITMLDAVYTND